MMLRSHRTTPHRSELHMDEFERVRRSISPGMSVISLRQPANEGSNYTKFGELFHGRLAEPRPYKHCATDPGERASSARLRHTRVVSHVRCKSRAVFPDA